MANDFELGRRIHAHLKDLGIETPLIGAPSNYAYEDIRESQDGIMQALGLDLSDDSLCETPDRVAKMYSKEIFTGLNYSNFPKCTTVENKMKYREMVLIDKIEVKSMCEHHFLPFIGHATVAYLPDKKVMGLSKFNRIVGFFSRRPQIQERLTEQISAALRFILETEDVAVIIKADHYCVKLRGVEDHCSDTTTSRLSGKFLEVPELRQELLTLMQIGR